MGRGWIVATENSFHALTNDEGYFEIKNVPPGRWKLTLWHETLGTQERMIEVKIGGHTDLGQIPMKR